MSSIPPLPENWYSFFGKERGSEALSFLNQFDEPTTKTYGAGTKNVATYYNFYPHGFSILFENDVLDSVYLYKDGVDGYKEYTGALPLGISWSMNNVQIVKLLGEPKKKTPKNNAIPIWLEYTDRGLTVNFKYKAYEDLDNPLCSLALFPPSK